MGAPVIPGLVFEQAPAEAPDPEGLVASWALNDDLVLRGYRAAGARWLSLPGIALYRFGDEGDAVALADGAGREEADDAWVRSVLPLVLQARGTQVLHASAALTASGSVLALSGSSTAGKSTLAAALLGRGRTVVADDALGFAAAHDGVAAYPLPFRVRLHGEAREQVPLPAAASRGNGGGSHPFAGVVVLAPAAAPLASAQLSRLAAADAFGVLMPHAYCFSLEEGKEALVEAYLALAGAVPVWRLDYPQRIERLDETVDSLERMLDAA